MKTFAVIVFLFIMLITWSQNSVVEQPGVVKVTEGIYVLVDYGCNIAFSAGEDGLLIIDTGYEDVEEKLDSTISSISNMPVRYVLNTHFHYDHAGGNGIFAKKGAVIVAHENSRKHMQSEWKVPEIVGVQFPAIPPYPEEALPKVCFTNSIRIHINNDTIDAIHYPNGHSDGDAVYYFRKANVIHTGDLFLSNGFTFIDIFSGGSVNAYIEAVNGIIGLCDDKTIIISGHGPLSDRNGLIDFREMLVKSRDRIQSLINQGKSLDEILKTEPLQGLYKGGESWLSAKLFIYALFMDLTR